MKPISFLYAAGLIENPFRADGSVRCPNCKRTYWPKLGRRNDETVLIQDEFPNATAEEREQLLSGLCCDKCWKEYLGAED